jgi:hypothetical protein
MSIDFVFYSQNFSQKKGHDARAAQKGEPFCQGLSRSPHPGCDALFLLIHSVRVDRSRGELSVAQPFLHHVEGNAPADRLHTEAVPQALWGRRGGRPGCPPPL